MIATSRASRYSALVEMELQIDGRIYSIAQVGSGFLILSPLLDLPPSTGEVLLRIDGRERRFPVRLDSGASSHTSRTPITSVNAAVSAA